MARAARLIETEDAPRPRAAQVSREVVISAIQVGMGQAVREFEQWTDGESLAEWGVEALLTANCARSISRASRRVGGRAAVTLEQSFGSLLDWSARRHRPGRPPEGARRLIEKAACRVDLVIWNGNNTPRAVVEVKRSDTVAGLVADAERLTDFVRYAGRSYGGSVRYGLLATVFQHPATSSAADRNRKLKRRIEALRTVARDQGFRLKVHGPTAVRLRGLRDYCAVETVVFEFALPLE